MNKEKIKEILDKWKCYIELTKKYTTKEYEMLKVEEVDKLLDYITNLQEENKKLNIILQGLANQKYEEQCKNAKIVHIDYVTKEKLQERINKAIEYIENSINNPQPFYKYIYGDENGKVENLDKLLNILKGDE